MGWGCSSRGPQSPWAWRAAQKGLSPLPLLCQARAVIPIVPGSIGSTGRVSGTRVSLCFSVHCWTLTMAGKGPDAPILCPKTLPMLVMVLGLVMSWHMQEPSSEGPCLAHKIPSKVHPRVSP